MHLRRPFRHKRRRYHYHPAALGQAEIPVGPTSVSRRGVFWTGTALFTLAAPIALVFLTALLLRPDNTRRWLSAVNAEWLAPWFK
jgi:hypothetical protein